MLSVINKPFMLNVVMRNVVMLSVRVLDNELSIFVSFASNDNEKKVRISWRHDTQPNGILHNECN